MTRMSVRQWIIPDGSVRGLFLDFVGGIVLALLFLGVLGIVLAGCHPNPPPPVDVCPNLEGIQLSVPDGYELVNGQCVPTTGPRYLDMLLRRCGTGQFCVNGVPIQFRGAIGCCMGGPDLRWPLVGPGWMDWARTTGNVNFFHGRPGPCLAADEPDLLPASASPADRFRAKVETKVGCAYQEVNGKADLTKWNEAFWSFLEADIEHAGSIGAWYEVDLIDSWRLKFGYPSCAGAPTPWNPARNIQGENHCGDTHNGPGDAVHEAYLKKLMETTSRFGNVIYQIGNESAGVAGKTQGLKAWEKWVYDTVRKYETVTHMIGTCSGFDEIEASFPDYTNVHNEVPAGPQYGKPAADNEKNPQNSAAEVLSNYCRAAKGGAYFWGWRAELSDSEFAKALADIAEASKDNCASVQFTCPAPSPDPTKLEWHVGGFNADGYDVTPTINDCAYCAATGQGNGGTRCNCPARMECPGFGCQDRVACEQVLMQAFTPVWVGIGGTPTVAPNGWRARCDGCTHLDVCNGPKTICRRVF